MTPFGKALWYIESHYNEELICLQIGAIVNKPLHDGPSPYTEFVAWISGSAREHPIEIFTTNYDLLFEQALERVRVPFFDGFCGANVFTRLGWKCKRRSS
jgi:hypothetical protein